MDKMNSEHVDGLNQKGGESREFSTWQWFYILYFKIINSADELIQKNVIRVPQNLIKRRKIKTTINGDQLRRMNGNFRKVK